MIKMMLIAGAGGFVGTCCRFLLVRVCSIHFGGSFPLGTFLVNVIGCFLFGLFFGLLEKTDLLTSHDNLLLMTGFCGGFTTMSAFVGDMWQLGDRGDWGTLLFYMSASLAVGILLMWVGRAIAR